MNGMFKRIALFVATNVLILLMVTLVFRVFGLESYITKYGLNYGSLAIFSLIAGFGGAFLSLAMSKWIAKWLMKVRVIQGIPAPGTQEAWLVDRITRLAQAAGLPAVPEIGIYENEEVNAFATGATKRGSLVAVSRGLLQRLDEPQVEAVLAHEIGHIANGDMVTMTLLQGVINTFVIFLSRTIAFVASTFVRREMGRLVYFVVMIVMQIAFSILGSLVVMAYSRQREFRADAMGAKLTTRDNMISALERLKTTSDLVDTSKPAMQTMRISGGKPAFFKLLMSHPPLEARIERLRQL
jgi:heat shock protein HtpX